MVHWPLVWLPQHKRLIPSTLVYPEWVKPGTVIAVMFFWQVIKVIRCIRVGKLVWLLISILSVPFKAMKLIGCLKQLSFITKEFS